MTNRKIPHPYRRFDWLKHLCHEVYERVLFIRPIDCNLNVHTYIIPDSLKFSLIKISPTADICYFIIVT